jgi:Icc-related predicted phosphoesterase
MRLQLFSDLHFEHFRRGYDALGNISVHPQADVVVLAGDIDSGESALRRAAALVQACGKPVVWVAGNHEFYGDDYLRLMDTYRASQSDGVYFLQDQCVEIDGVRFCGCVLWTDFRLYEGSGRLPAVEDALRVGNRVLNDFRVIRYGGLPFTAEQSLAVHAASRAWLETMLDLPFPGKTVVITHHAPHPRSIHPRFSYGRAAVLASPQPLPGENPAWPGNVCFASDLTPLVEKTDLWLHGHIHDSMDYQVGRCRIVANPRGYPYVQNNKICWENPAYEPLKLIDL